MRTGDIVLVSQQTILRAIHLARQSISSLSFAIVFFVSIFFACGTYSQTIPGSAAVRSNLPTFLADQVYLPSGSMLGFVEIPAGSFLMGSNPLIDPMAFENERWSAGRRQGRVDLPTYYIGKYEVTVAQYRYFAETTGYRVEPEILDLPPNQPVVLVSWTDAIAYARWLETVLKGATWTPSLVRQRLSQGWHVALPTEAEWEKAARGESGFIYPWGNSASTEFANFGSNGAVEVGSTSCTQCSYDLQDMSGNVWEWTQSPSQAYPYDPSDDRDDLSEDALWIMRGGSFNDQENNVRAAVRGAADPGARRDFIGFRIVLTSN
jgi:formylglycine-generating enzyme required for sulfatase activity